MTHVADNLVQGGNGGTGQQAPTAVIVPVRAVRRQPPADLCHVASSWTQRYGEKHHLHRILTWPCGILPPRKVRVYFRADHFVLQWWDPAARTNLSARVNGDLIEAIAQARAIDRRLLDFKNSGQAGRRLKHADLVGRFLQDLNARADAGSIGLRTVRRYAAALQHYLAFTQEPRILRRHLFASQVNREFSLQFGAFLKGRRVAARVRTCDCGHLMQSDAFVWDVVRAAYQWASDPDRGALLPAGFRSPFRRRCGERSRPVRDPFGEPDITVPMAGDFLAACDAYQLRLFAPLIFYGLRAAEPCYLFGEYVEETWLRVPCNLELAYTTKGRRDKRLPLFEPLASLLTRRPGLLMVRRAVATGSETPALAGLSLEKLVAEFQRKLQQQNARTAARRQAIRDTVLREASAIDYDHIEGEFHKLAGPLGWPRQATLKDFRHLFASSLANAGMPEPYRQYLMGQATSRAAISVYTHLNQMREQFLAAIEKQFAPLIQILRDKSAATHAAA